MKKTMLFLFIVLFLDCIALGYIQDEISLYGDFFQDLRYFPLAVPKETSAVKEFSFEDTWMAKHHREGTRKHEGCDIFGKNSVSGYYPVVSMTDGTVENVGWLPLGGWRIGIRSRHGGYFYYAHLHSYGRAFSLGDKVKAGEMLGLLGDSGYGEEGTIGKFTPHLHIGIYVETAKEKEHAVNPYPVLRYLQGKTKKFVY